jgi:3-hydroxy-3-methylglutaryl CoA synthase
VVLNWINIYFYSGLFLSAYFPFQSYTNRVKICKSTNHSIKETERRKTQPLSHYNRTIQIQQNLRRKEKKRKNREQLSNDMLLPNIEDFLPVNIYLKVNEKENNK